MSTSSYKQYVCKFSYFLYMDIYIYEKIKTSKKQGISFDVIRITLKILGNKSRKLCNLEWSPLVSTEFRRLHCP